MRGRFARRLPIRSFIIISWAEGAVDSQIVPRFKSAGYAAEDALKMIPHVRILARIADQDRVVAVPGILSPAIEDGFLPGIVRMQRRHHAARGIVENDGADADLSTKLECIGGRKERLVLANRVALVVEDCP